MEHPQLEATYELKHSRCGAVLQAHFQEWPPKIFVCPHCKRALRLKYHNELTGKTRYSESAYGHE